LTQKENKVAKSFIKDSYLQDSEKKPNEKRNITDLSIREHDEIKEIVDKI
jgi:hypothetical protein